MPFETIADKWQLWAVILGLGATTFLLRFSFLGLIGNRILPGFLLKMLRYTPMAMIPGLVAPGVVWPAATGGEPDPARLIAAMVTIAVGIWFRSTLAAVGAGVAALMLGLWGLG